MIIRDILAVKKQNEIYGISPDAPVSEAVGLMVKHDVGSLVVQGKKGMVGLLTQRQLIQCMAEHACNLVDARVKDLMVTEPVIGSPDDTVDYVRGVMTDQHLSHLPVMQDHELLGIISFHDVARACLSEADFENRLLKRYIKHWPE